MYYFWYAGSWNRRAAMKTILKNKFSDLVSKHSLNSVVEKVLDAAIAIYILNGKIVIYDTEISASWEKEN